MIQLLRFTYFTAAALSLSAACMVTVSMLMPERAPHSAPFWVITIGLALFLAMLGILLLGIAHHLPAIGALARSRAGDAVATEIAIHWRRLAVHMLVAGLLLVPVLLLIAWAVLARMDEGFALFG